MPTPTGLPRVGEVWERTFRLPPEPGHKVQIQKIRFVVLERGTGSYWSLRVHTANGDDQLWTDASYWQRNGQLRYIGLAGPETKKKLGLG